MLDPLESITGWTAVAQVANIAAEASTVKQGAAAIKFDKNGAGATEGSYLKKHACPIDVQSLRDTLSVPTVKLRTYHANYTNVAHVAARFVYRYTTAGVPDIYDDFRILKASLSNSTWNTLSVELKSPTNSIGSPTAEHRSKMVGAGLVITMDAAANTIVGVIFDALEIVAASGTAQPGCLIFGNQRLITPPLDTWNRLLPEQKRVNEAPQAVETIFLARSVGIQIGMMQVRSVHRPLSQVHTLEESLRRFAQYAAANQGWGVAFPAGELIDTTLNGAVAAEALSIIVTSATEFSFLGLTSTIEAGYADIRIGPNASREYEWCRAIGVSGTTVYLDRPLQFAHASGIKVRSAGYYPSMASLSNDFPVQEGGKSVRFDLTARETA